MTGQMVTDISRREPDLLRGEFHGMFSIASSSPRRNLQNETARIEGAIREGRVFPYTRISTTPGE
jgi:hypothetical protein